MTVENQKRLLALLLGLVTIGAGLFSWRAGLIGSTAAFDDRQSIGQDVEVRKVRCISNSRDAEKVGELPTRATLTEQVRERSFVNLGCPGSFYPRVRRSSRQATTCGSVSAFTRRPSA